MALTPPMRRHYELPFGAEPVAEGVRFRVWAPGAQSMMLVLEGEDPPAAATCGSRTSAPTRASAPSPSLSGSAGEGLSGERPPLRTSLPPEGGEGRARGASQFAMHPEPGGWWSLITGNAAPGTRYRYRVDGVEVPDPASRYQPRGVHAASEVIDPAAYAWSDQSWQGRPWEQMVIYELHVGAFSDEGTFVAAVSHLDELVEVGVTAIELMPVAAFPGERNWGYDGVQLFAPAACYGRPEDLKTLVEACHARGLAVLLDVVYNHFGPEGNYLHVIARDFFTERHHTPWGAGINFDGPTSRPVRDFMLHNALYWLEEFHLDGLRLDAVHAIVDDSQPDIVGEIAAAVRARITDRHIHLILENDHNEARRLARGRDARPIACSAQWNDDLHHALHVLTTGQTGGYYGDYAERPIAHLGRALASGFAYQGEPSPYRAGSPRGEPSGELPPTAFVSFLQNHDQIGNTPFGERITGRAPEALLHAAVAIVLLSPQVPLLFMGEEWATLRPFLFFCDFAPQLAEAVRQGRRREFAQFPEFAEAAAQDRLPDPTAETSLLASRLDRAEREREPHAEWLRRYRSLLALRARAIAPRLRGMAPGGEFRLLGPAALRVDWRLGDGSTLRLLANFADSGVALTEPAPGDALLYCSSPLVPDEEIAAGCAAFFLLPPEAAAR
jgi:malto-oligosyltrehalose trehalohydrolase